MPYLCILVRCKECQHTERSRSTQGVRLAPSPPEFPDDLEGHEAQRSQKDLGVRFAILLVVLVVPLCPFVLGCRFLQVLSLPSLRANLVLPDFQAGPGFQGSQFDRVARALRGCPGCQGGRGDRRAPGSCCDIRRESG